MKTKLNVLELLFFSAITACLFYLIGIPLDRIDALRADVQTEREAATDARAELDKANRFIERVFNLDDVGTLTTWSIPVTVSAYTARAEECDSTPETTADNTPSRIGLLAVSRDLLQVMGLKYGETVLLIDGDYSLGVFKIHDTMNARFTYRVDILHGNVKAAREFGIRKGVQLVRVLDYGKGV